MWPWNQCPYGSCWHRVSKAQWPWGPKQRSKVEAPQQIWINENDIIQAKVSPVAFPAVMCSWTFVSFTKFTILQILIIFLIFLQQNGDAGRFIKTQVQSNLLMNSYCAMQTICILYLTNFLQDENWQTHDKWI